VHGSMPAERCDELLELKLTSFGLSLAKDIVSICTDGASVMTKVGKLIEAEQQLCYAHGIQLAVIDVLYKRRAVVNNFTSNDDENEVDEDDAGDGGLEIIIDDFDLIDELSDEYERVVSKVRKVVKLFRRSPTKNDAILQKYVTSEFGKELTLILDCKTRWSSLLNMLSRFLLLRNPVLKAMVDVREKSIQLSDSDFNAIQDVVSSLEPVKLAVEAICRRDTNLITAEAAINFCIVQLTKQSSELAKTLAESLEARINERRALHSGVLQYLNNPASSGTDAFPIPTSASIRNFILSLLLRLDRSGMYLSISQITVGLIKFL